MYDVCTAKNTVISSNFLVCKFCEEKQFPHSFGRFTYLLVQSYVIFSRNIIERVYLTKQKSKIFKVKYTVNFKKDVEVEKKLQKSKKTEDTSELEEGYQKAEFGICWIPHTKTEAYDKWLLFYLWNILCK